MQQAEAFRIKKSHTTAEKKRIKHFLSNSRQEDTKIVHDRGKNERLKIYYNGIIASNKIKTLIFGNC
jgi:hypothetical protein